MTKKVISFLIAVTMLFTVFTVTASAALESGTIGMKLTSTAKIGDPVDTIITVKFYLDLPDADAGKMLAASKFTLGYNSEYYSFVSGSRTWGDSYSSFLAATANVNENAWTTIASKLSVADTAKGYSKAVLIQQTWETGAAYNGQSGYPVDEACEVFTVQFKVLKTLTDAAYIGIPDGSLGTVTQIKYQNGTVGKAYTAAQTINTEAITTAVSAGPAVANGTTQVQWADKANGKMNVGFRGVISGWTPAFSAGTELNNIEEIGVLFSRTDSDLAMADVGTSAVKVPTKTIYNFETGTYFFRAIVKGVAYDSAETLYSRAYIVVSGSTILADATASTNGAAEYQRAVNAGMTEIGA